MTLCGNCKDADLEKAFENRFVPIDGKEFLGRLSDLNRVAVPRKSDSRMAWKWNKVSEACELCDMLKLLVVMIRYENSWDGQGSGRLFRLPGYIEPTLGFWQSITAPRWGLIPTKGSLPGREGTTAYTDSLPISCLINSFERIRSLLGNGTSQNHQSHVAQTVSLKTIDCQLMCVASHPASAPYLALSYVWGGIQESGELIEGHIPKTIQDAMIVTRRLGYRYLWVDRYCIDQQNAINVAVQLHQMDRIYQNAAACIIAAAGNNPHHGLPGVSDPRFDPSSPFSRDISGTQINLAHRQQDLWKQVKKSRWVSRGWTFQELLFSRNRIFFTDSEFIVDTGSKWYHEFHARGFDPGEELTTIHWPTTSPIQLFYGHLLPTYSARKLTYSNDILRGFTGVLNAYRNLDNPLMHLYGVPYQENRRRLFLLGLSWDSLSITRRYTFPSWTWCGWFTQISFTPSTIKVLESVYSNQTDTTEASDWPSVHIQLQSQQIMSIADYSELALRVPSVAISMTLILRTWYISLRIAGHGSTPIISDPKGVCTIGDYIHGWDILRNHGFRNGIGELDCRGVFLDLDSNVLLLLGRRLDLWERLSILTATPPKLSSWLDLVNTEKSTDWSPDLMEIRALFDIRFGELRIG